MPKDKGNPAKSARKSRGKEKPAIASPPHEPIEAAPFPVVGIGASAGGLEAFTKLLQKLPNDTGMAFVLIQHLDPKHESILTSLLSRATRLPVLEVTDRMRLEPNHVYVIPRNTNMKVVDSMLLLTHRIGTGDKHMPVDYFFQSLAESQKSQAIGVILSGTATDGTAGLRAIKSEGGITFAQDPTSARFDGMPRSAISASVVDFVLSPEAIARELAHISRHPYVASQAGDRAAKILEEWKDDFDKIFALLRTQTGSDFSLYKRATIDRRVRRRMVLRKIVKTSQYVKFLQDNPAEVKALYEDLLINVTEFFRDPKAFEALSTQVFPKMVLERSRETPIRIWVPGCSTGEEVYSIAVLLVNFLAENNAVNPVQIFGTDLSETAIAKARFGLYSEGSVAKVPADLLHRYFAKIDHGYRIGKRIRDLCVFARQDLTKDPPFSKVDLISCRNVLIYLGPDLQNKVMPIFHYALKPDGYLLLGSSETVAASNLFALVDKNNKIYTKKPATDPRPPLDFSRIQNGAEKPASPRDEESWTEQDLQKKTDRIVLAKYGPAGVVVNERLEIIQFRGDISPYLRPASGVASLNLFKMLREDLVADLHAVIDKARKDPAPVRRQGLRVDSDELRSVDVGVEVILIDAARDQDRLFLVLFQTSPRAPAPIDPLLSPKSAKVAKAGEIERLDRALTEAKRRLQFLTDERQASEEELRSANEEILSSNEELQSTNEELETSQEELQSANEELTTVNDELQLKNTELAQLGNDLSNLLNSVSIPIVMLGNDLHVRHFTPAAGRVLNLRSADVGRPIMEIKSNLEIPGLEGLLSGVVRDLAPKELDVQDRSGAWYSLRIRPYRTDDNKIDGALMVLYDVDQIKRSLQEVRQARDFSQAIVETVPAPLVILDSEQRVITGNAAFYDTFHLHRSETEGQLFNGLAQAQWNIPRVREVLDRAISQKRAFTNLEMEGDFQRIGRRVFVLRGSCLDLGEDKRRILLLAMNDITVAKLAERKLQSAHTTLEISLKHAESSLRESEADLRQSREELRTLAARLLTTQEEERRRVSRELHDDLNQKLAMLEVDADRLGQKAPATPGIGKEVASLRNRVAEVSNDIRRVAYQLHPSVLDHLGLGVALRAYCTEFSNRDGIRVKFSAVDPPELIPEDVALCLYRVTQESLRNVAKHASAKVANVTLETVDSRLHLCVKDNGVGFDTTAKHTGGIGLLSIKERVRLVDGEFKLKSKPGQGTRIDVWAPLMKGTK